MPHICSDEILMILAMIPFIGAFFRKIHNWYHVKFKHQCHEKVSCNEIHLAHQELKSIDIVLCYKNDKPSVVIRYYNTPSNNQRIIDGQYKSFNDKCKFYGKYINDIEKIEIKSFRSFMQRELFLMNFSSKLDFNIYDNPKIIFRNDEDRANYNVGVRGAKVCTICNPIVPCHKSGMCYECIEWLTQK